MAEGSSQVIFPGQGDNFRPILIDPMANSMREKLFMPDDRWTFLSWRRSHPSDGL
jgi:hypothetical protein